MTPALPQGRHSVSGRSWIRIAPLHKSSRGWLVMYDFGFFNPQSRATFFSGKGRHLFCHCLSCDGFLNSIYNSKYMAKPLCWSQSSHNFLYYITLDSDCQIWPKRDFPQLLLHHFHPPYLYTLSLPFQLVFLCQNLFL